MLSMERGTNSFVSSQCKATKGERQQDCATRLHHPELVNLLYALPPIA